MRALESELDRTFPAIKKQIDSLDASDVIDIDKEGQAREIVIKKEVQPLIKNFLLFALDQDLQKLIATYDMIVDRWYKGHLFGNDIQPDLVIIHKNADQ
ncbi:MAG: hypothetical protein H6766_03630 [Candidatus Peribacteria bacterium]|nr:MAG: hypothetical protein H6766_03630 [Candidatus Peribacteria bacterium]